ncbi:MAG: PH domain-containing protein [Micropruina sp.]|uniref:PH domain-containing protein n=1 Tax=Micropruina sp. TaxID=2737536 RepID=UPI0039E44BE3
MSAPVSYRPVAALRMGISLSASLVLASGLGWVMTPVHIRNLFTPIQILTLLLFLAIMVGMALALGLSYVRADDQGLTLRNGVRTHVVPWSEIKAFRYRDGDPWAFVVVRGVIEQRPLMGIQRSDRDLAEAHVADLRARLAEAYGVDRAEIADEGGDSATPGEETDS